MTLYQVNPHRLSSPPCSLQHPLLLHQLQGLDVLSVGQVEGAEQGVVLRGRLAGLILVQEDGRAAHFHAQLLDSLLVVDGQQEGLEAGLGAHCGQDGEVLGENTSCATQRGGAGETGERVRDTSNTTD